MTDKKAANLEGAVAKEDALPLSQVIQLEKQALLNTFPEEIWEKVLNNVTSVNDLENLAEASSFFKTRVEDRRVVYLFKRVLPILYPTLEAELKKDYANFWDQADEQIERALDAKGYGLCTSCGRRRSPAHFSGLLDLRLVCKAWCHGVDSFCENLECRFKMMDHATDISDLPEDRKPVKSMIEECSEVKFGKVKRVRAFMNHFEESHGEDKDKNPFLGRSIALSWRFDKLVCEFDMESTEINVEGKNEEGTEVKDEQDNGNDSELKASSAGSGDLETASSGSGNGNDMETDSSGSGSDNDLETSSSSESDDSDEWEDIPSDSEGSISSNSDDDDSEGNPIFDLEMAKLYNNQALLKKYGHHVWYCKIDIYDHAIPSEACCAWLIQMLKLMPNLKVLRIDCNYLDILFKYEYYLYYEDEWMESCLNGKQFPKLNSLEYLSGSYLSRVFALQIIKQSPNLKQLELLGYSESPMYGYETLSLISGNSFKRLGLSVSSDDDWDELKNILIEVDWPLLETLYLEASGLEENSKEDVTSWVKSKFGENCKFLMDWHENMFARFILRKLKVGALRCRMSYD